MPRRPSGWIGLMLVLALPGPAFAATLTPASVAFGGQSMATTSPVQTVTFTNDGASSILVSGVSISNTQFTQTHNCGTVVAGGSCSIFVTFKPAVAAGALNSTVAVSANLTVTHTGAGSPNVAPLTGTAEKSLVTHYYRSILRRAPDAGGKAFWENEAARMQGIGVNVNEAWFSLAMQFYFSPEYLALNRNPTGFVTDLFNTFFNRPPDSGGLAFWTGEMSQGMPREVVLAAFMFSAEFSAFAQSIFGNTTARAEVDVVVDFFRGLLARLPDNGGFNYWVGQFRTAQCTSNAAVVAAVETISSSFQNSAEYAARSRSNTQYIGDLYNAFLRRGGDLGGVNYWVGQLNSGAMTRSTVRQAFVASAEFNARANAIVAQGCLGGTYYISPAGNNSNTGLSPASPWKTFSKAFTTMAAGDQLVLLDGTYSVAAGTGIIGFLGTNSGQPKSGLNLSSMTVVRAQNPGQVTVDGPLFIGRTTRKDYFIKIQGITFTGGVSQIFNGDSITIKEVGFNGGFVLGTNSHDQYNDNNLIEDVWIWAAGERVIAINYRSRKNVWRRVVVRGDGCGKPECQGAPSNPNVGITVYDSSDITLENVLVVDRLLLPGDSPYADFASAQHTAGSQYLLGRNYWLGCMSVNSSDTALQFGADFVIPSEVTATVTNFVAVHPTLGAANFDKEINVALDNATLIRPTPGSFDGLRIAPGSIATHARNIIAKGFSRGVSSYVKPSYVNTFGNTTAYFQTTPTVGVFVTDPQAGAPAAVRYPTRIETGSNLKGAGNGGADIGANVVYRYGVDGTRFGEPGYNTLTTTPLWPWPNEARIKAQMCATTTRGFCSAGKRLDGVNDVTLTSYIWEYFGNPIPAGIYP